MQPLPWCSLSCFTHDGWKEKSCQILDNWLLLVAKEWQEIGEVQIVLTGLSTRVEML